MTVGQLLEDIKRLEVLSSCFLDKEIVMTEDCLPINEIKVLNNGKVGVI